MEGKIITGNSSLSGKSKLKMAIYGNVMYLQVIWTGTVPVCAYWTELQAIVA